MPKKTRKQKRIAELHRSIFQSQERSNDQKPHIYTYVPASANVSISETKKPAPQYITHSSTRETATIRADLVKTLILAMLALGAEFALYFLWEVR